MAYSKRSYIKKPNDAELAQRAHLRKLVELYEDLRSTPGGGRNAAYPALALALANYGQTFVHGEWSYTWSDEEESVLRRRMHTGHHVHPARPTKRGSEP